MAFRTALTSILLSIGVGSPVNAQVTTGPIADAVVAYLHAATAAYQRNDVAAIDSLVADGFILTDSRGTVTTKADDLESARTRAIDFTTFRNEDMLVRAYGTTAIVTGRTIIKGTTKQGAVVDIEVQFTDTVIRFEGRWKIVASHVSRLKPAPS